jgi:hypothetical protein
VGRIARLTGKVEKMADYVPTLDATAAARQLAEDRKSLDQQRDEERANEAAE